MTTNFSWSNARWRSSNGRVPLPIEPKPIITMGPSKRASNAESVICSIQNELDRYGRSSDTPPCRCVIVRNQNRKSRGATEMPALPINFACGLYDRMLALYTGDVKPDGIDLNFIVLDNPREIFDRMTGRLEFDVCEMSSSEYISRLAAQKLPFVALPVFASRVFRHGFIIVDRRRVNANWPA